MTTGYEARLRVLAARFRPSFSISLSLSEERAQGKPGADCARRSRAPEHTGIPCAKHMGKDYRYSRDIPAFPTQWLYGFLRALPGERRLLSPLPCQHGPAGIDATVAAPGPHDFAVRCLRSRPVKKIT